MRQRVKVSGIDLRVERVMPQDIRDELEAHAVANQARRQTVT
jgi:hypothetical protein